MFDIIYQKAKRGTISSYLNIASFSSWAKPASNCWVGAISETSVFLSPPKGSDFTKEELNASLDAAGTPLTAVYQLETPLFIPLSDEAQAVLDSIRLPAGTANVFTTNSPAPDLKLTYRKTVISLPASTAENAGMVPVVRADGTGYELTGDRLPQVLAYTHTANPEIHPASYDAETGVFTCAEPHGIGEKPERWLIAGESTVKCLNEWGRTNSSVMLQKVSDTEFTVNDITSYGSANNSAVDVTQFHFEKTVYAEFTNLSLDKFIMMIMDKNIMSTGVVNFEGKSKKGSATILSAYTHGCVTAIRAAHDGMIAISWNGSVINNLGFAAATDSHRVCETDEIVTKVNFGGNGSTGLRNGAQVAIYAL